MPGSPSAGNSGSFVLGGQSQGSPRSQWHHPGRRYGSELTLGERAADGIRNGMGSWIFVFIMCTFLAAWMLVNRDRGFDPYPFILLNLILSCVAAMQGAILLIAAKREDQVSSELAQHNYEASQRSMKLVEEIYEHLGLSEKKKS